MAGPPTGKDMNQQAFTFETWAVSHQGCVRELNEDRYLMAPEVGLWVVADGMGGHDAGEVASAGIVEQMATIGVSSSAQDQQARFVDRLTRANKVLQAYSAERNGAIVGATVVSLLAYDGQYACMWMGDARVYLIRKGKIRQLSRDHSEVQELVERGVLTPEEARTWPRRNVITRAVGVQPELDIDVVYGAMEDNDSYLLCSDGLTAHVTDQDILDAVSGRRARQACEILLEQTLSRGGTDNVTIVIVQCRNPAATIPVAADTLREA
jgi:protein phosphatase